MSSQSPPSPRDRRRRLNLFVAVAGVAALAASLFVAAHTAQRHQEAARAAAEPGAPAATGAVPVPSGAPSPSSPTAAGAGAAAAGVATAPTALRYSFDGGGSQSLFSTAGRYPLRIVTASGGQLRFVPRGTGYAVRFPPRCTTTPTTCPRAILEGPRADAFNPGTRPLRYGASVRMTRSDTGDGANVLQKGYSVGGSTQFKLQVDGAAGRPSCVIASPAKIYKISPRINVADGRWHTLACVRSGNRLGITIDGAASGSVYVPASLSIASAEPLRVGGKGINPNNDQFAGTIDDVFVTIS